MATYAGPTPLKEEPDLVAAVGTTWAGQAQTNDLRRLEMAETRTNYAPHDIVSGKDITQNDSIYTR